MSIKHFISLCNGTYKLVPDPECFGKTIKNGSKTSFYHINTIKIQGKWPFEDRTWVLDLVGGEGLYMGVGSSRWGRSGDIGTASEVPIGVTCNRT